jgi:hypothetical protein
METINGFCKEERLLGSNRRRGRRRREKRNCFLILNLPTTTRQTYCKRESMEALISRMDLRAMNRVSVSNK